MVDPDTDWDQALTCRIVITGLSMNLSRESIQAVRNYAVRFEKIRGVGVSMSLIHFKGTIVLTSIFPAKKCTRENVILLNDYLSFINKIKDHHRQIPSRLLF